MKHEIQFFEDEHIYLVDGKEYPSVTTILGYLSQEEYGAINPSVLQAAAQRGTLVHEYTELCDYGALPDEIEYEVQGYIKAYQDFLRDYKPNWSLIETPVFCEIGYVGTVDRAGVIDGKNCVVDIKTYNSPTKMQKFNVCCQTMAYALAIADSGYQKVQERYALFLNKEGEYTLMNCKEYEEKYDLFSWGTFSKCLAMKQLVNELKEAKPIKKGKK